MTTYVGQTTSPLKFLCLSSPFSDLILLSVQVSLQKGFLEAEFNYTEKLIALLTETPSSRKLAMKKMYFFFLTEKIKRLLVEFN